MRLITFLAWLMMIGGIILGFSFLALILVPMHPKPGESISTANTKQGFAICAGMLATICVLGAGLRTRLSWAWSGTVGMAVLFGAVGLIIPVIGVSAKNMKPTTFIGASVMGAIIALPALLVLRLLFRVDVKEAFQIEETPPPWIRVLAMSYLSSFWVVILTVLNPTMRHPFGLIQNRVATDTYEIVIGLAWLLVGRGLYVLNESARRWAIFLTGFTGFEYLCFLVRDPATPMKPVVRVSTLVLSTFIQALTIWYLHTRRHAFSEI